MQIQPSIRKLEGSRWHRQSLAWRRVGGDVAHAGEGSEFEEIWTNLIAEGDGGSTGSYSKAARLVFQHHGWSDDVVGFSFRETLRDDAYAITSGDIGPGTIQTIYVSRALIELPFAEFVRMIGHEWQHVQQHWAGFAGSTPEKEFDAYYWQVFNTEIVRSKDLSLYYWAISRAMDKFEEMDITTRESYYDKYDALEARRAEVVKINEGN